MSNDTNMIWNSPRMPPAYVKHIAEELGIMMHKKFPTCGTAFANPQEVEKIAMAGYWSQYRNKRREFWEGVKTGMFTYAYMKSGTYYVGTTGKTLKQAYAEIDEITKYEENIYDPIRRAALKFLEEAGKLPEDPEEAKAEADRIVQFIEDNVLAIMSTYAEVLLDEEQK